MPATSLSTFKATEGASSDVSLMHISHPRHPIEGKGEGEKGSELFLFESTSSNPFSTTPSPYSDEDHHSLNGNVVVYVAVKLEVLCFSKGCMYIIVLPHKARDTNLQESKFSDSYTFQFFSSSTARCEDCMRKIVLQISAS